jgi:serine/threonine protein kinase
MENVKVIAQISRRFDSRVDRVAGQQRANSLVAKFAPKNLQLRRKLLQLNKDPQCRQSRMRVLDSFEALKKSNFFEFCDVFSANVQSEQLKLFSRWIDGRTVADQSTHESRLLPDEPERLKDKLHLWVRFFEKLSQWHALGICHGNLKPGNLLVCENLPEELVNLMSSEFFTPFDSVPQTSLLDGGYHHLLESSRSDNPDPFLADTDATHWERTFWLAPEACGLVEGAYTPSSDVFSMAAIMAKDFGFTASKPLSICRLSPELQERSEKTKAQNILHYVWPALYPYEQRVLYWNDDWFEWSGRTTPFEGVVKRLKQLLTRCLEPSPEKRLHNAREIAFELKILANRVIVTERSEESSHLQVRTNQKRDPVYKDPKAPWKVLQNHFDIPPEVYTFLQSDIQATQKPRLWCIAKNRNSTTHHILRRTALALHCIDMPTMYLRVRHTDKEFPFATLDRLVSRLLLEIQKRNPQAMVDIERGFAQLSQQGGLVFQVLPSLHPLIQGFPNSMSKLGDLAIHARHEALHFNLDRILPKLISASLLEVIVLDDFHRADSSSMGMLLRMISAENITVRWIMGTRSEETRENNLYNTAILKQIEKDQTGLDVFHAERGMVWATKLNQLKAEHARTLSSFCTLPYPMRPQLLESFVLKSQDIEGLYSPKVHDGKSSEPRPFEDGIGMKEAPAPGEKSGPTESNEALGLVAETLRFAITLGICGEDRDPVSGRLIDIHWSSERIGMALSHLLSRQLKAKLSFSLAQHVSIKEVDTNCFSHVVRLAELFRNSDLAMSGHAAFGSLMRAAEFVSDLDSVQYLTQKFQMLEERLERQRSPDCDNLIPRIREEVGDLSRTLGNLELSAKYYEAVSWNLVNPKRRSILALKSFFPSQLSAREDRTKWFFRVISDSERSGLIPLTKDVHQLDPNLLLSLELRKLSSLLKSDNELQGRTAESQPLVKLVSMTLSGQTEDGEGRLTYNPRSRAIRESIFAQFLRAAIGWIDNSIVFPYIIRALHFAVEQHDGPTVSHTLFTLLLCGERTIRPEMRAQIFDFISDVAARTGNETALAEAILFRAWTSYFYDGNLSECKRALESLRAGTTDLPESIKLCSNKLFLMLEFESHAVEKSRLIASHPAKIQKKFRELGLAEWDIGFVVYGLHHPHRVKLKHQSDESLVSSLLSDQIDQILLFSWLTIEGAQLQAQNSVVTEAKKARCREWFADERRHQEYLPESVARLWLDRVGRSSVKHNMSDFSSPLQDEWDILTHAYLERDYLNEYEKGSGNPAFKTKVKQKEYTADRSKGQNFLRAFTLGRAKNHKKEVKLAPLHHPNWADDVAITANFRFELAATPDPEKTNILAQTAAQAGYQWLAHRLCKKTGTELTKLLRSTDSKSSDAQSFSTDVRSAAQMASHSQYDHAVALNYVLEFVHNLQRNALDQTASEAIDVEALAECLNHSVPVQTNLTEAAIAEALKAAIRRMGMKKSLAVVRSDDMENEERKAV